MQCLLQYSLKYMVTMDLDQAKKHAQEKEK